jgi:DNA-binding SARP family transcriptional activator/tetratricopeptide (TPR) repeat protein
MRFEILGPLRVWRADEALTLGPIQQRVVLAVLLLQGNRPIGRDAIISAVWGDDQPARAVNLIHRHVSALRRVLEPERSVGAPSDRLVWTDAGYLLTVPSGALDLDVFDSELRAARDARAAGDLPAAADLSRSALGRWRGPVCDGLTSPFLDARRAQLAELRISALEERIDLDLTLGNQTDVIPELRNLVAEHPSREQLCALLMLALYRSGRQADALAAYRTTYRHLRDELGVEPGAGLRRLHQRILTADPDLTAPAPADRIITGPVGRPRKAPPVPAQLPHGMSDFTGRQAEIDSLNALLPTEDGTTGGTVVITAIAGMAGVGKTALALHWGHQVRGRFPDGQLYVNLRGFDPGAPAMGPAEAIRGFLDSFSVPPERVPSTLDGQTALYRSLLADRRVLVLLDNARDADQVRPLLPGSPGCLVVVTSRHRLTSLVATDGAHPLALDLLSEDEARQLLVRRLGPHRVAGADDAIPKIIAACARLPLALSIVAARAATSPHMPLAGLVDELDEENCCLLDAFDGGDRTTNVRNVFSWSYRQLSAPAAQLFRLLGLHPGPDASTSAIASLVGAPPSRVRPILAELTRAHLIIERVPGRFTLHDLLRAYARELVHGQDPDDTRRQALHRLLDHYLHTSHRADRLLRPDRDDSISLDRVQPLVTVHSPTDHRDALAWFTAEHSVLLATVAQAADREFDNHSWQLAWTLTLYFDRRGHWHDAASAQQTALRSAERLEDPYAQAVSHGCLAYAYIRLSRHDEAHTHLVRALWLYEQLDDNAGQAHVHRTMTWVLDRQGHYREALPHARRAFELFGAAGHEAGQARTLNAMGWFHTQLGEYEDGLRYCHRAFELQRAIGDRFGQADTLDSIGRAHHDLGQYQEAAFHYRQALILYREFGDRFNEADTLVSLGDTHIAVGDTRAAVASWRDALVILDELGHVEATGVAARLEGLADRTDTWRQLVGLPPPVPSGNNTS